MENDGIYHLPRAVDAAETDTFRVLALHFDGVAVEDGDTGAGEVGSED